MKMERGEIATDAIHTLYDYVRLFITQIYTIFKLNFTLIKDDLPHVWYVIRTYKCFLCTVPVLIKKWRQPLAREGLLVGRKSLGFTDDWQVAP